MAVLLLVVTSGEVSAAVGTGSGLHARYFPNETLSGVPSVERIDSSIGFDWGGAGPAPALPVDGFSARWTGYIEPRVSGGLTITARTDDGVRVWLDGKLVIDAWQLRAAADSSIWIEAELGRRYAVKVEYYEHLGSAVSQLLWQEAGGTRVVIPSAYLYPDPNPIETIPAIPDGSGSGLTACYFSNELLSGPPQAVRVDPVVNFDWASGSPVSGVPNDSFSARWSGELQARQSGLTDIIVRSDDGVRLWIDGERVINSWVLRGPTDSIYRFQAKAGKRYAIIIEYYEHTGGAVAQLLWIEPGGQRQVIPTTQLYPQAAIDGSIQASIPTESWTSPAFIEGYANKAVMINGTPSISLGGNHWHGSAALGESAATSVIITNATQSLYGNITWSVLDLAAVPFSQLPIRLGDALRVRVPSGGGEYVIPSGLVTSLTAGTTTLRPTVPGVHSLRVNGITVVSVTVVGFDVDLTALNGRCLALQRYAAVTLGLPPSAVPGLLEMEQSISLRVSRVDQATATFSSDVLERGACWFRISGGNHAILLTVPVQPYQVEAISEKIIPTPGRSTTTIVSFMKDSSYAAELPPVSLQVKIRVTPYVSDLAFEFSRFAHRSTFLGGASEFTVLANGTPSSLGEPGFIRIQEGAVEVGEFTYLVFKPRNEVSTCVKIVGKQDLPAFSPLTPSANN